MLLLRASPVTGVKVNASVLAHHETFRLGPVEVRPATKTIVRGGQETVVEPRVMQVLVALAEANGAVVSRDDLVEHCWDGRIVGDDAVNRIMSRLRQLASGVGQGSFVIETVTKVGYRLRLIDGHKQHVTRNGLPMERRKLVIGLAVGAGIVGVGALTLFPNKPSVPPESRALLDQALFSFSQDTREGQNQAEGILRQLVADQPDFADAWGALGMVYASVSHFRPSGESRVLEQRARVAGARALSLEPSNGYGLAAMANARPLFGNWLALDRTMRGVIATRPANRPAMYMLAMLLHVTGRSQESLTLFRRAHQDRNPTPGSMFIECKALWYAGRLDEADRLLTRASELYPTHFALWFQRFYMSLYTNRADAALAMALDTSRWPSNIPEEEIERVRRVAEAMIDPGQARVDRVMTQVMAIARIGAGFAENSAQFAAALGRPKQSMAILHAYYFGEGFTVPEVRFTAMQGSYTRAGDRMTNFLFAPSMASLHPLPEFSALTQRLGLADYWRRSKTKLSPLGVPID